MEACNQGVERANTAITTPYFDILKGEYYENNYSLCPMSQKEGRSVSRRANQGKSQKTCMPLRPRLVHGIGKKTLY
jgi:hypothetical protein